jgi:preprotein translocase subunit SecF
MMHRMRGGEFRANIVGRARLWFIIAGLLMLVCVASLGFKRINAGLEFRGGTAFQMEAQSSTATVADVKAALTKASVEDAEVQKVGARGFLVQTKHLSPSEQQQAEKALAKVTGAKRTDIDVTDVGPKWGRQITSKATRGLIIFLFAVVIYLSIRLEPKMAGSAFVALVHDVVLTAGIYSIAGFEVTPSTVIAILTILGYSLYDTVVIFDRVKERTAQLSAAGRVSYSQAANEALNHVLIRSLNTSMTALLPVGSLLIVGSVLLGAQTLRELALALFVGISAGTFSSIFIATPLLAIWKEREPRWATLRARIAARGPDSAVLTPPRATPSLPSVPSAVATTPAPPVQQSTSASQPGSSSGGGSGSGHGRPTGGGQARAKRRKKRKRRKR